MRFFVLVLSLFLCRSLLAAPSAQDVASAKKFLQEGAIQTSKKQWNQAVEAYKASLSLSPSADALLGLAHAYESSGFAPEALDAYEDVTRDFAPGLTPRVRTHVTTRMTELSQKVGTLQVSVNEPQFEVQLDGRLVPDRRRESDVARGEPMVLRVLPGEHTVRVTKPLFEPSEKSVSVTAGARTPLSFTLARESQRARLVVREQSGARVSVFVDGEDKGPAPWTGDVTPGQHEVLVRGTGLASPPERIVIEPKGDKELVLVARGAKATLRIRLEGGAGRIYVDDKLVGEGEFSGDVSAGPHVIAVSREGFERFEKKIELSDGQVYSDTLALHRKEGGLSAAEMAVDHPLSGLYGGAMLAGAYLLPTNDAPGGDLSSRCSTLGAYECSKATSLGGGVFGYVGYFLNPVGFEWMVGGLADTWSQTARFDPANAQNQNALFNRPAREESFRFLRAGGITALRARLLTSGETLRLSVAFGVGLSYKRVAMKRDASTPDGLSDSYVPDSADHLSPALTLESGLVWRVSRTFGLTLGALLWGESAGDDLKAPSDSRFLVAPGRAVPVATPEYTLARGTQLFLGPYLGVEFGP